LRQSNGSSQPNVSFVVPARNEARLIGDCVDSLRFQSVDVPFEIIVVDNGSTDATAVTAAKHGARVVFESRAGLAYARQAGLDATRGIYIVYVDADSRLPATWTRDVIARFERDPRLVAVSTGFTFYDGRTVDNIGNVVFREILAPLTSFLLRLCGHPEVLIGSAIVVRTDALRKANGIDQAFQFYGEDTMLARRIHSRGEVRFLRNPPYQTSARRYQQRGLLSVVYRYFLIFALIHLGRVAFATRLARRFHERDRSVPQRTIRHSATERAHASGSSTPGNRDHHFVPNASEESRLVTNGSDL
jgi:glycosyltransferase involved in cell wall biosynthesis